MASCDYDWQNKKTWKYKGKRYPTRDPQYIKDRKKLFKENGNGWWWGWQLVPPSKRPIDLWRGKIFEPKTKR
jgi:hypothetical protein|tara:strand:+ start:174 stop:389 length:216 start_codon:yes stop_codon:yes gene_type:complete